MKCPQCKGRRFIGVFRHQTHGLIKKLCPNCLGYGEIDWLQNIFGIKPETCFEIMVRMPHEQFGSFAFRAPPKIGNTYIITKPQPNDGRFFNLILDISGFISGYYREWT